MTGRYDLVVIEGGRTVTHRQVPGDHIEFFDCFLDGEKVFVYNGRIVESMQRVESLTAEVVTSNGRFSCA